MNRPILFEDEHVLVVHKPSGINTHKPDRYAPDGIHEWLTKREPRWAKLSILHRLDKDTSGVMLFGKTTLANQSLSRQFESHQIEKQYLLLSSARPTRMKFRAKSVDGVTEFEFVQPHKRFFLIEAQPITGKTHQIRRHAAENRFPIVGDTPYGGEAAPRLMLHAHRLTFEHPARGERMTMEASVPAAFDDLDALVVAREFRELLFGELAVGRPENILGGVGDAPAEGSGPTTAETDAFRLIHGAADGFADVIVDSYAGNLLVQWQTESAAKHRSELLDQLKHQCAPQAIYEQLVTKQKRTQSRCVWQSVVGRVPPRGAGDPPAEGSGPATARFPIRENGLTFLIGFGEGLSTGLFLDQRENRWRLLTSRLTGKTVLNCFAYTCGFSVAAAKAGAVTTSIDLSRNSLEWGKDNFRANDLSPEAHSFLVGDVFEWLRRLQKRGQTWDVVILDPPTFSTTKQGRAFQAERDYADLLVLAIPLVAQGGLLFCSTNQRTLAPDKFEASLRAAARQMNRIMESLEFETLPFDFRVVGGEHPYLKTLWARLD